MLSLDFASAARTFRSSVLAGLLWLAAFRIGVVDPAPDEGAAGPVWDAIRDIATVASPTSEILALVVGSYLAGVFSEAAFGALARWLAVRVVDEQRVIARLVPWFHAGVGDAAREVNTMRGYLATSLGRAKETFAPTGKESALAVEDSVRDAWLAARSSGAPIVGDVERLRGEAEFRLYLLPPLLGLTAAVASHGHYFWLALLPGLVLTGVVAASANHAADSANDELAHWREAGTTPSES